GDGENAGVLAVAELVEAFQELDGVQVFIAPEGVGDPFPRFAGIVEVEHGGDGIDSESVDVVAIEPEQGITEEEISDLGAAVVEDLGAPVAMFAQPGIGMLVEMRAIKVAKAVNVVGEVSGNPVEDHSIAMAVQGVDEVSEIVRRAEPCRGG